MGGSGNPGCRQLTESAGPFCSVGEACEVVTSDGIAWPSEIVGFRSSTVLSAARKTSWSEIGDQMVSWGARPSMRVGSGLLGRVIDANGTPLDDGGDYRATAKCPVDNLAPSPLSRVPILEPLGCGIRAVDAFLTCGRGQRVGIFGGSGVGKSTLIGIMTRGNEADLTVLALVGGARARSGGAS